MEATGNLPEDVEFTVDHGLEYYEVNSQMVCQYGAVNYIKLDKLRKEEERKVKRKLNKRKRDISPGL